MKQSIAQEMPYGCGIACFAFVCDATYNEAAQFLGYEQANSSRFFIKHFREELNRYGKNYISRHVRPNQTVEPCEGMIVLLRRSRRFPVGHYLAYHEGKWMDPWINLENQNIKDAQSGFRETLPGDAMYTLSPEL